MIRAAILMLALMASDSFTYNDPAPLTGLACPVAGACEVLP